MRVEDSVRPRFARVRKWVVKWLVRFGIFTIVSVPAMFCIGVGIEAWIMLGPK